MKSGRARARRSACVVALSSSSAWEVVVESISRDAGVVTFRARARADAVRCPRCRSLSWRVHGRYERRLADAAVGTAPVVIRLTVRRFK
ncbi:transposase family protein [Streptomyces sp. IBSNAI002]|uniref:transposase family protein n=1 Tax=Streptomyces sp. IBSNAI002 TaxID=3457500 RepID=UPI003FD13120